MSAPTLLNIPEVSFNGILQFLGNPVSKPKDFVALFSTCKGLADKRRKLVIEHRKSSVGQGQFGPTIQNNRCIKLFGAIQDFFIKPEIAHSLRSFIKKNGAEEVAVVSEERRMIGVPIQVDDFQRNRGFKAILINNREVILLIHISSKYLRPYDRYPEDGSLNNSQLIKVCEREGFEAPDNWFTYTSNANYTYKIQPDYYNLFQSTLPYSGIAHPQDLQRLDTLLKGEHQVMHMGIPEKVAVREIVQESLRVHLDGRVNKGIFYIAALVSEYAATTFCFRCELDEALPLEDRVVELGLSDKDKEKQLKAVPEISALISSYVGK